MAILLPGMTIEMKETLKSRGINNAAQIVEIPDQELLELPNMTRLRLLHLREAIGYAIKEVKAEVVVEPEPDTQLKNPIKFEWTGHPHGTMSLNANLGYMGNIDILFDKSASVVTTSTRIVSALRVRKQKFGDIRETKAGVNDQAKTVQELIAPTDGVMDATIYKPPKFKQVVQARKRR